jgi:hypothetical protein
MQAASRLASQHHTGDRPNARSHWHLIVIKQFNIPDIKSTMRTWITKQSTIGPGRLDVDYYLSMATAVYMDPVKHS